MSQQEYKDMNSYEKNMLLPFLIMKIITAVIIVVNFWIPIYAPKVIGCRTFCFYVLLLFYILSLLNGIGVFFYNQNVYLGQILAIRAIQFIHHFFFSDVKINIYFFIFLCILDIMYCAFFMYDRSKYEIYLGDDN